MLLMILSISSSLVESMMDAIAERIFTPWSATPSGGPKQPRQGMFPLMQRSPQPERVTGPKQM